MNIQTATRVSPDETPYVVTCHSTTGTFELTVSATSRHRALDRALLFIQLNSWDGTPIRARHAH